MRQSDSFVAAVIFLILASGSPTSIADFNISHECECGESGEGISNRIIGGFVSIPHTFPWITAIFHHGIIHCGGALINDRYVLTAGHCVKWVNQEDLLVGVGLHDLDSINDEQMIPIDKVILHEGFKSYPMYDNHDVSLLRLKRPVQFNENVKPACLPHDVSASNYAGQEAKAAGWGLTKSGGKTSRFLRQTIVKVLSLSACRNTSIGEYISEIVLCAYYDGSDTCQGDSGGPLVRQRPDEKYEVIGVVSWGIGCATKGMPGVYVKVVNYLNWIDRHTKDSVYCLNE